MLIAPAVVVVAIVLVVIVAAPQGGSQGHLALDGTWLEPMVALLPDGSSSSGGRLSALRASWPRQVGYRQSLLQQRLPSVVGQKAVLTR